jgi:hypothetical protein
MCGKPSIPLQLTVIGLLLLVTAGSVSATTVYRWLDADGVVHWSDRPVNGSMPVEVPTAQAYRGPTMPGQSVKAPTITTHEAYTSLAIIAPADGDDLFETGGVIQCTAQLTPHLRSGDTLWFELDGQRYDSYGNASLSLPATRGEHVLKAMVLNAQLQALIAAAPVTFRVHQHSVTQPPVGPEIKRPR